MLNFLIQNWDKYLRLLSVGNNNPFSLAIVKDGKNMIGKKLLAVSPLKNTAIEVEIISLIMLTMKERVRS